VTGKVVRIENCVVAGNTADSGGGIRTAGHVLVRDCTVVDNHALETGGGIEHGSYVERPIENCVLWGNSAPDGAQLSIRWSSAPVPVRYCDVQGGQAAVDLGSSVLIWGPGNLTAIPQFVDADGLDNNPATYVDNDYRLSSASPCIDAGDTSVLPADVLDLDGDFVTSEPVPFDLDFNPRRIDIVGVPDTGVGRAPVVDIGAYERQ
jgi:hypothetical protein